MNHLERLRFLSSEEVRKIAEQWGTPVFVYDEATLQQQARKALAFNAPFGLTVRYAMKANSNSHVLSALKNMGVALDASSGFEAERAMHAGMAPEKVLITAQELPKTLTALVKSGVQFNACSLHQLEMYGSQLPGTNVSIRINPGLGSGHSNKTNVGGPASSFGIWHEHVDKIKAIAARYNLTINRLHTHIGSGTDPAVWTRVAHLSLDEVRAFPDVTILNLGGGFKVGRMHQEQATDLQSVSSAVADALEVFYENTGRQLQLEIEPGSYLVANAGSLITTIHDIVDTGEKGYTFLKIDSGMTEILRPILYGAQHPLVVINDRPEAPVHYVVVGHCCESADLLTSHPDDPEVVTPRLLQKAAIGDRLVIESVGAYCASMSAHNYNSYPLGAEVMRKRGGRTIEINRRQTLEEMVRLESPLG
jgi:diaminopimelate decarboxylase